ncbi:MAG TPA: Nif3-like dinuclear metal center hexameric protein [Spirochaetales bacterium]|nr:Nif3-like dinuclear metal center hexameric protein [Spirochaetales bacterium]
MDIGEFARWADQLLAVRDFRSLDDSLNGLQLGRSDVPVRTVAFAVDACYESIMRAREAGAQLLFVHHGLFWGKPVPITGTMHKRIAALLEGGLALYACHLPLDAHAELGNNACLARMLGLTDVKPFGVYHGVPIGFKGTLEPAITVDQAIERILPGNEGARTVYPFGPKLCSSAALVSGGAPFEAFQAIDEGVDLYITGESSHSIYHGVMEAGINVVSAGHYATETHGVRAVAERAARELGLQTLFIELPTGL